MIQIGWVSLVVFGWQTNSLKNSILVQTTQRKLKLTVQIGGEYKGSVVEYVPEDEKTRARNFVH